jgi:hypothetical protein
LESDLQAKKPKATVERKSGEITREYDVFLFWHFTSVWFNGMMKKNIEKCYLISVLKEKCINYTIPLFEISKHEKVVVVCNGIRLI